MKMHCQDFEKMPSLFVLVKKKKRKPMLFSPSDALKPPILFGGGSSGPNLGLWVAAADFSLWLWGPEGMTFF